MIPQQIDWTNLGFSLIPTHAMFQIKYSEKNGWHEEYFGPFSNLTLSPAATILNYGQGIFEGLKAHRTAENKIQLFRPQANITRLNNNAKRFCMPEFPAEKLLAIFKKLVSLNADFVPPYHQGSLYLRPCLWGITSALGVKEAEEYLLTIYCSPVGSYFKGSNQLIDLSVCENHVRAAPLGCGDIKCVGNYAGVMLAKHEAKEQGFADCLFLDAVHRLYIEETCSSNFFAVADQKLVTPRLGSILPGITRDSILRLAQDKLKIVTAEVQLTVAEVLQANEIFLSGTAAAISPVGSITYRNEKKVYHHNTVGPITLSLCQLLYGIQTGDVVDEYGWIVRV